MKDLILIALLSLILVMSSCHEKPQPTVPSSDRELKESLEKANRVMASEEEEDIVNFVRRHQWEMISTGTGMRYQIVKTVQGPLIQQGQRVTAEYALYDIFGDVVYCSDTEGLMDFVVGYGGAVDGIDEAIRHLHVGDQARVIVPSHLGYGLVGDQKKVPGRATLIYTLNILKAE